VIDWSALDAARRPLAPSVGPFPHGGFLSAWWEHFGSGDLEVTDAGGAAWAFVTADGCVTAAGAADLVDYRSPLGGDPTELFASVIGDRESGTRFSFDSLPVEAAEAVTKALEANGVGTTTAHFADAMVLVLDGGDHLDGLDAKQRHEVRRKQRRFDEALGEALLVDDATRFEEFVTLHRAAPGDKGEFMTREMESFFRDLLVLPGARLDCLVTGDDRLVAASFGFEDADAYYLYNSAYDPAAAEMSPGIVLLHRLIRRVVESGLSRFDFLKGTDAYKRRLGAEPRPLYLVEGVL
jgi:CelD/BcsL family acetyltransferase involved in cellulose biosynthesis